MYRHQQLFIFGISIVLGFSQTGCGVLSRLSGAVSFAPSTRGITDNSTGSSGAVSISSVTSGLTTKPGQTGTHDTTNADSASTSIQPVSPYPSFGLDVTGPEVLALNERLAELGYLPVTVDAATQPTITLSNLDSPPQDSFKWRYSNVPPELASQWSADTYTEMTRAAVIAVEHVNGLSIDGIVGEAVWKAILGPNAVKNPNPYTYVLVTKNPAPEELRIWQAGKWIYHSIVNTGVSGAPSTNGTFAVYERFASQEMKGTNPDGTKYDDPGVPYVNYYNDSEAIHGYPRTSYGFPQSVGCVELPVSNAKVVWSLLDYGTLVTVEGKYVPPTGAGAGTESQPNKPSSGQGNTTSKTSKTGSTSGNNTSVSSKSGDNGTSQSTGNAAGNNTGNTTGNDTGKTTGNATNNTTGNSAGNSASNTTGNTVGNAKNTTAGNATSNEATSAANGTTATGNTTDGSSK